MDVAGRTADCYSVIRNYLVGMHHDVTPNYAQIAYVIQIND